MSGPERIWARQMAPGFRGASGTWNVCEHDDTDRDEYIRADAVAEMIRQAVEAEREACAQVCEEWGAWNNTAQAIAAAIRARGEA